MSIVITVVTKDVVVQVSDVQLTSLDDGKPLDEKQRKSALVVGTDAAFVIGWTGFAKSNFVNSSGWQFKTGDWLFNTLNHIKAYEKPLVNILGDLTGQADFAFNRLADPQAIKGIHFVLGGWHRKNGVAELFTAVVFNDMMFNEQQQLIESPTVDTKFLYSLGAFRPVESPHLVHVDSPGRTQDKLKWTEEKMRILRIVMSNQGGEQAIVRACVDVIRQAADWTRTISKEVIVATLKQSGDFTTDYLSKDDKEERLVPDIITPSLATTQGTIKSIFSGDEVSQTFNAQGLKR
jgi:hypothetical protein